MIHTNNKDEHMCGGGKYMYSLVDAHLGELSRRDYLVEVYFCGYTTTIHVL